MVDNCSTLTWEIVMNQWLLNSHQNHMIHNKFKRRSWCTFHGGLMYDLPKFKSPIEQVI